MVVSFPGSPYGGRSRGLSALTKARLADRLFEYLGFNKGDAKEFVDAFFEEMRAALERGEPVKLSGFGNFEVRQKNARPGRNPKTGKAATISARRVVVFRPGLKLRTLVEQQAPGTDSE